MIALNFFESRADKNGFLWLAIAIRLYRPSFLFSRQDSS